MLHGYLKVKYITQVDRKNVFNYSEQFMFWIISSVHRQLFLKQHLGHVIFVYVPRSLTNLIKYSMVVFCFQIEHLLLSLKENF